jgi:hypothetical protein
LLLLLLLLLTITAAPGKPGAAFHWGVSDEYALFNE